MLSEEGVAGFRRHGPFRVHLLADRAEGDNAAADADRAPRHDSVREGKAALEYSRLQVG